MCVQGVFVGVGSERGGVLGFFEIVFKFDFGQR